ncbi:hypothetical protein B566_EDAN004177, partial [Ephemera danica]
MVTLNSTPRGPSHGTTTFAALSRGLCCYSDVPRGRRGPRSCYHVSRENRVIQEPINRRGKVAARTSPTPISSHSSFSVRFWG